MKFFDILKDANQNLLRNKLRTFLTILAIFIGSFSIISTSAIQSGVNEFIDSQVNSYGGDGYLAITASDSMDALSNLQQTGSSDPIEYDPNHLQTGATPIDQTKIDQLKQIKGIDPDSVREQKNISVTYITSSQTDKKYIFSAQSLPSGNVKIDTSAGRSPDNTQKTRNEITLDENFVKALGYTNDNIVDQDITVAYVDQYSGQTTEFTAHVVGVIAPGVISLASAYVNTHFADAIYDANTANYPAELKSRVYAVTASYDYRNYDIAQIRDELRKINLSAMTIEDIVGSIKSFFDVILTVFRLFGYVALLAAAIGIINTLFMSVQERTREIGLDKALGMSSKRVFFSFSLEAIMLGFWGSVFGIIISMLIGNAANVAFHASGGVLEAFPTFNIALYTWQNMLNVTIIIMLIAFLAGTLPARQAAHKNPIDALRYE